METGSVGQQLPTQAHLCFFIHLLLQPLSCDRALEIWKCQYSTPVKMDNEVCSTKQKTVRICFLSPPSKPALGEEKQPQSCTIFYSKLSGGNCQRKHVEISQPFMFSPLS